MRSFLSKLKSKGVLATSISAFIILCAIIAIQIVLEKDRPDPRSTFELVLTTVEELGVIISIILATHQLSDSKEIARATFLSELNKTYVENEEYIEVYDALQNCLDGICPQKEECDECGKCLLAFPKSQISNYLTFFETLYLLIENNAVSFRAIDDLFAYRFFLAVHSQYIQQMKLAPQPDNFANIFKLEHEWLEYRKKIGKIPTENDIYGKNTLDKLVTPEKYKQLIKKR